MTRRLLGPVGGSLLFLAVAGLVFAGLGWVTDAALRVEAERQEAAARAEHGHALRAALWRLDGRLVAVLGGEDARPYPHYLPYDPAAKEVTPYGPACGPLLSADLPEYMLLHVGFDEAGGWTSPQVLSEEASADLKATWPGLDLRNATEGRIGLLGKLRDGYPARHAARALAVLDRGAPADRPPPPAEGLFFDAGAAPNDAAPAVAPTAPAPVPPAAAVQPAGIVPMGDAPAAKDRPTVLGVELPRPPAKMDSLAAKEKEKKDKDEFGAQLQAPKQPEPPPANRGGQRGAGPATQEFQNERSAAFGKSAADARGAGRYSLPMTQNVAPLAQNNVIPTAPPAGGTGLTALAPQTHGFAPGGGGGGFAGGIGGGGIGGGIGGGLNGGFAPAGPGGAGFGPPGGIGGGFGGMPSAGLGGSGGSGGARGVPPAAPGMPGAGGTPPTAAAREGGPAPGGLAGDSMARLFNNRESTDPGGADKQDANKSAARDKVELLAAGKPGNAPALRMRGGGDEPAAARAMKKVEPPARPAADAADKAADAARAKGAFEQEKLLEEKKPTDGEDRADRKEARTAAPAAEPFDAPKPGQLTPPVVLGRQPAPADGVIRLPEVAPLAAAAGPPVAVHLGPMRPLWLPAADGKADALLLVRAVRVGPKLGYQGVVLDWDRLKALLLDEVNDLFPAAELVKVKTPAAASPDRAMTALPVELDAGPEPAPAPPGWTPLRLGLVLAWAAAVIAVGAVGLAGWSLIDLSERRIRFVSAVTHELRTPLTSLRLYLDLLLSGMVTDETKRTEYLATLNAESDRLHRLIDNVLDFARLERRRSGHAPRPVPVADLLGQLRATWADRCGADGKDLVVVSTLPPGAAACTDPDLFAQIVGNLVDNARKYSREATDPRIWVWARPAGRRIAVEVEDRGPGVPPRERGLIFKPFRRGEGADTTAGGAGLGLALAKQWAEAVGGRLSYRPADGGTGACFRLELPAA